MADTLTIRFDGSCSRNGRPGARGGYGWSAEVGGAPVAEGWGRVKAPLVTNNVAEFFGLVAALEWAVADAEAVESFWHIVGDSMLVIGALNGWKMKAPHLRKLRDEAVSLLAGRDWRAEWRRRDGNARADYLAYVGGRCRG